MNKFKISTLSILISFLAIQEIHSQDKKSGGSIYLLNGIQYYNLENLNSQLTAIGYKPVHTHFSQGFGGYGKIGKWIIGGEGMYFTGSGTKNDNITKSQGGLGYFYAGYNVLSHTKYNLYTSVGIGLGGLETTLVNKTNATVDAIISTSPNARNIGYGSLLAHTSLNISRVFGKSLLLGFKSGYNFGLGKHNWSADGNSGSQGSFSDTFNNFYLHMQVGLYVSR